MESYYGVIYFRNGTKRETNLFSGFGADLICEKYTQRQYEVYMKVAVNRNFEPCRYEVKRK